MAPDSAVADGVLESLPGGKCGHSLGGDLDLLAVHRAAARARLALARQEGAEADHGDALALGDVVDDRIEDRVYRFAGRELADVAGARRGNDQIRLGYYGRHALSPFGRTCDSLAANRASCVRAPVRASGNHIQIGTRIQSPQRKIFSPCEIFPDR